MEKRINIAIDGPAGAGKSTIAKEIAKSLNIVYLDTGAMYRAFTYFALKNNVSFKDEKAINELLNKFKISYDADNDICVNGSNVAKEIRTEEIDKNVSDYCKIIKVREKMVDLQREIAGNQSIIMDGRDIGSVVLPDAEFKFYLDADAAERAKRRVLQNKERGIESNYDEILADIIRRDKIDSTREVSPLVKTDDAVFIDSTNLTKDEVVDIITKKVMGE